MTTTSKPPVPRSRYHANAFQFVFAALRQTQHDLRRGAVEDAEEGESHISGQELLDGIRTLALNQFGLMTLTVFRHWGVHSTDDFGRIVFELIELGEMRKTQHDRLRDFCDVFDFSEVFDRDYRIDTRSTFLR